MLCLRKSWCILLLSTASLSARASSLAVNANYSFAAQQKPFVASFNVKPGHENMDATIGLSVASAATTDAFAVALHINASGVVALNGATYQTVTAVPYFVNTTYIVELDVNPAASSYTAYVSAKGTRYLVAKDFAFAKASLSFANVGTASLNPATQPIVLSSLSVRELPTTNPTPTPAPQPTATPTPTPVPTPTPAPISGPGTVLKAGDIISFGGLQWGVQTDGVIQTSMALLFKASTGDFANFDPPDGRKILNEVCSLTRFAAGQLATFEFDLTVYAPAIPHTDLQWFIPFQIHAADTRDSAGNAIPATPLFAMDVQPNSTDNGYLLHVQGETDTLPNGGFVPQRLFASVPFTIGSSHHVKVEIVDSHGQPGGSLRVTLDGVVIVNQPNIPVGYAFVDTNVLYGGKMQENRSYPKLGIYAGNQFKPAPVTLQTSVSNFVSTLK